MFTLKSAVFFDGGTIPEKHTEMSIVSPPLNWENAPEGTKSFALTMTDPDVPEFFSFPRVLVHWMVCNIPASANSLPEGASPGGALPAGSVDLNSDFITSFKVPNYPVGYAGPWPPDKSHRYVFTLYALKTASIDIAPTADYVEFISRVLPQTIAAATIIGNYGPAKQPLPCS